MNIEEADIEDSIRKYSKYIGHVHFADSNRKYPGSGHVNFAAIINALEEVGYTGYVPLNIFHIRFRYSSSKRD